jgi:hypothetical protein
MIGKYTILEIHKFNSCNKTSTELVQNIKQAGNY